MPPMPPALFPSPTHSPTGNTKNNVSIPSTPASATTSTTTTDDMTIKTDETTAIADNTTTNSTTNTNSSNNNKQTRDDISDSTRERARSHWTFIKSLHRTQKRQLFKMGSNTSLTTAEATFLNMITKSRLDVDHDSFVGSRGGGGLSGAAAAAAAVQREMDDKDDTSSTNANERSVSEPVVSIGITDYERSNSGPKDDLAVSGRTHFSHLVQAAVAKENLRKAISARLSSLSGAEAKFLTKLVNNKSVSLEALNNALHVLDNDPLYNEKLRREKEEELRMDEDDIIDGLHEEEEVEGVEGETTEEGGNEEDKEGEANKVTFDEEASKSIRRRSKRRNSNPLKQSMRRVSGVESSMLFDKMLDESENGRSSRHSRQFSRGGSAGSTNLDGSMRSSGHHRRKSSVNERNLWEMATIHREELASMSSSPTSGGSLSKSERVPRSPRSRNRSSRRTMPEKSLWNLTEEDEPLQEEDEKHPLVVEEEEVARKQQYAILTAKSLSMRSLSEDEDGLPILATKAGEAIDPLLMAAPVEKTPMVANSRKTLPSVESLMDDGRSNEATPASGAEEEGGEKKGLDELLTTLQPQVEAPGEPLAMDRGDSKEQTGEQAPAPLNSSFVDESKEDSTEVTTPLLVCCGMEGMSIMDVMGDGSDNSDKENANQDNVADNTEEDSLASKKRYLHLETADAAENEQRVRLSTWIGKPEDYPILGLGKKRKTAEEKSDRSVMKLGTVDMNGSTESNGNDVEDDGVDPLEPHVLSPLLMKCLRDHLPFALREENFWLKYSLARDGASLEMIFSTMRHSQHTILAIETTHGEVFGSFTSSPWRNNGNGYYGSCEAFVWMLRKTRPVSEETCGSLDEYILRESSLDVFQWNHGAGVHGMGNRNIQLSNTSKLFVGGGNPDVPEEEAMRSSMQSYNGDIGGEVDDESKDENEKSALDVEWGMALALDKDLLRGTSSRCATFASNPLIDSSRHEGSEVFEIMNLEIWALTPCMNEEMAEELELGRTFVMGFHKQS